MAAKEFSENLFWDTNPTALDMEEHISFILQRVLEYGTWNDWLLLRNHYTKQQIVDAATQLRSISSKSLNFISLYTNTPIEKFRCYQLKQSNRTLWNS